MMLNPKRAGRLALLRIEGWLDEVVGPKWNPLYQLGALSIFFLWIVTVSGIYLYIVFDTAVVAAYQSVEYLTNVQWYAGGVMRSFHRYASDGLVVTMLLHLLREYVLDRYRGMRWFVWVTGVPLMWMVFVAGINGYWLVWDRLGQYIAVATTEWLDWLPMFGEPVARNFLTVATLSDRFFTLLVFTHLFVPLFLVLFIWIHLVRISRPKINPSRSFAVGIMVMLLALSFYKPAVSQGPADLSVVPQVLNLDWFYLNVYPLMDRWPVGAVWALLIGTSALLTLLPWLPPMKREPVAKVDLKNCNGCSRCFVDCPFGAVTMEPRTDGRPFKIAAVVDPAICTSCGICAGACPTSTPFRSAAELVTGIDLPHRSLDALRTRTVASMAKLEGQARVLVYGCDHAADVKLLEGLGVAAISLPCIGNLPPSFIDFVLGPDGVDGVFITGCREGDCFQRLGVQWTEERISGARDPYLRQRVPKNRIRIAWGGPPDLGKLVHELREFRADLEKIPSVTTHATTHAAPVEERS